MTDHDELLAAEKMLERWEQGYELHKNELIATIERLYEALRAALAAQLQPPKPPSYYSINERLAFEAGYRAAAAGSATSTGDDDGRIAPDGTERWELDRGQWEGR